MSEEIETITISTYDPVETVKKFLKGLIFTMVPVILVYAIQFMEAEPFPTEYAILVPFIVGVLNAVLNWWKNRSNTAIVNASTGIEISPTPKKYDLTKFKKI